MALSSSYVDPLHKNLLASESSCKDGTVLVYQDDMKYTDP
jgi:hypothetical protein